MHISREQSIQAWHLLVHLDESRCGMLRGNWTMKQITGEGGLLRCTVIVQASNGAILTLCITLKIL